VPREPVTTTTVPAPPPTFLGQVLLALVAFLVLFVLPPCTTSPTVDLAVLATIGLRAAWTLARCLRWRAVTAGRPVSQPLPSADAARGGRDGVA
jgi:hypothetical protein